MGTRARDHVIVHYDWAKNVESMINLYRSIVNEYIHQ
jgi:hypothetical protein